MNTPTMKLAYVAGPYRGRTHNDVAQNIAAAREVAAHLWSLGYAVICPHLNSAFMSGVAPEETFLRGGIEILRRCDLVVLVPNWHASQGTTLEIEEARSCGLPIFSDLEFVPPADAAPGRCANG
ncbi:MAG TPA: DUF4406 domain-containing protein [bacterium]|nr:DUF4406 domain-containing protein [bacterium]